MNNTSVITQRFIKCHNKLRENKTVKSSRQFAVDIDYLPQSLSEILKGRRDVTIEVLRKSVEIFKLNPIYLFTGEGSMFLSEEDNKSLRILTVMTDVTDEERIVHVPVPAQTSYAMELNNPKFIQNLPNFTLPDYKYKVGTHRSFDAAGDSMEPTLFEGDKIVCSFIEPTLWESGIKDGYVYVIVTQDDIVIRRVYNFVKTNKLIEVHSDNKFYEPYNIPLSMIREIWYVRAKISPFLPAPNRIQHLFYEDMNSLKNTVTEQSRLIEKLNQTIQKLVDLK
ncbi:MAG: peptidase S24 [Saprospiraceae bacterium]|nr:peptidase S24 [Saprospiraceae bacterium]